MTFDKCIVSCIYHYNIIQNSFTTLKISVSPTQPSSSHRPMETTNLFTISMVLAFWESHIRRIVSYVTYCFDYILSLRNVHLRLTRVLPWLGSSFLFLTDSYPIVWMYHSLFIHPLQDTLIASNFRWLWTKPVSASMWRVLWGHTLSNLEAWLLDIW